MIDKWRSAKFRLQTDIGSKDDDGDGEVWSEFDNFASDSPMPEEVFKENEAKEDLLKMLNQLKKEEREILVLRFLEELEYVELARIYKTSESNMRQKVSRSLQNLKKVAQQEKKN
jgi:RNA polymerase sigma factor (sigma-70 family)